MSFLAPQKAPSGPPPAPGLAHSHVYLHAGQLAASADPCSIVTILGSCVAVCVFDRVSGAGGANHYLLPSSPSAARQSARFGDVAIELLVARMALLGSRTRDLEAKLFGGASVVLAGAADPSRSLGMQNVVLARRLLEARGIPVVAEDVGGTRGRKITFRTDLGDAWVRKL
jgi:chemotaxis protein CheD